MSGIYIHIPFCKKACYYCDFHFSTNTSKQEEMVQAIVKEIKLQKDYLKDPVQTIYFGGGTPSLLTERQIGQILSTIYECFHVKEKAEITLESNPDDLNVEKLKQLKNAGVNRLSIGIQSFHNPHLQTLNRIHTGTQAIDCIHTAQDLGIDNITIDLIYGIPHENHSVWEKDLATALSLKVPHISSYCLTIEEKTVLGNWVKKGKFTPAEDEFSAKQFEMLVQTLSKHQYQHYEISNFALEGWHSRHNAAYWQKKPYLGVGPSAHSFNGKDIRQFNKSNNALYLKSLSEGEIPFEKEVLSLTDQVNEYLLTSIRTIWGTHLDYFKNELGFDFEKKHQDILKGFQHQGLIRIDQGVIYLTEKGKLLGDMITEELFTL